ncbi:hypothetical protein OG871_07285 [Kitasatospora sp. NBC_00374]|uniref:hypothetical protein n=1 Tax=Kitasatospora sp. NBC_00374 TaxID=2975964 RepID=UPI00324338A8
MRTVICVDSGPESGTADLIRGTLPRARVWSLHGSPEAWAIGHNGPDCDRNTFHPFGHQHVELRHGEVLVTTVHDRQVAPVLRYRTGAYGEFTRCSCGDPAPALRLLETEGDVLGFRGARLSRTELVSLVRRLAEVEDVEPVVVDRGQPTERLRLEVRLDPGATADQYLEDWIRECVIREHIAIGQAVSRAPESFEVLASVRPRLRAGTAVA